MVARSKSTKSNSTTTRSTRGKAASRGDNSRTADKAHAGKESASSMVLQLVGSVVGDSLSESVSNLKDKVTEQVEIHGQEYLESARERIVEATAKVVKWGKEHPVKTVAAAAALIAVSGFLYATLHGKVGQAAQQTKAKLKRAAAMG